MSDSTMLFIIAEYDMSYSLAAALTRVIHAFIGKKTETEKEGGRREKVPKRETHVII